MSPKDNASQPAEDGTPAEAVTAWRNLFSILPDDLQSHIHSNMTSRNVVDNLRVHGAAWNAVRARRLTKFIIAVDPYFKAMDVFVSCDPIHAATLWGALRVVIQLGFGYVQFLDKFMSSLESIAKEMDYFLEVKELGEGERRLSSPRVEKVLKEVFVELSDYLLGVFRMFYRPNGASKHVLRVLATTAWRPFQIDGTLNRLRECRANLQEAFALLNLTNTTFGNASATATGEKILASLDKAAAATEKESEYAFVRSGRQWLAPPDFDDRFRDALDLRDDGTTQWLLQHEHYQSWTELTGNNLGRHLWVGGKPGAGKTVLAASVIDDLLNNTEHGLPVCYYFFSSREADSGNSNSCAAAYRAILAQLLQKNIRNERIRDLYSFAMHYQSAGQLTASREEAVELAELAMKCVDGVFIVLDALDECDSCDELLLKLRRIGEIPGVRLAMFSRHTVTDLPKRIARVVSLAIGLRNETDIKSYLRNGLAALQRKELLPKKINLNETAETLTTRADGMFLWARLLVMYLASPALYPAERQQAINQVGAPEGLRVMFERIIGLIERSDRAMRRTARQSFLWLLFSQRPMLPDELESAFIPAEATGDLQDWKIPDFENTVIRACAGFVERDPREATYQGRRFYPFRFIHATVKEYLMSVEARKSASRPARSEVIPPERKDAHAEIATVCLKYLTVRMPAQPLSGKLGKSALADDLLTAWPLSNYAALCWTSSLLATADGSLPSNYRPLFKALDRFLSQPKVLMAWIETCYTYSAVPGCGNLQTWGLIAFDYVDPDEPNKANLKEVGNVAYELGSYLSTLDSDWGHQLRDKPCLVWEEVTAFNPTSMLAKHGGIHVKTLQCQPPPGVSYAPINRVSQLSPDGETDVVLSVYPSRAFDDYLKRAQHNNERYLDKLVTNRKLSRGWLIRFEVISTKTRTQVACLDIPLPEIDIFIRACESFVGDAIQIPISLSRDCRFFSVLRTIYHVRLNKNGAGMTHVSQPLPIETILSTLCQDKADSAITFSDFRRTKQTYGQIPLFWIYFDGQSKNLCYIEQKRRELCKFVVFGIEPGFDQKGALRLHITQVAQRRAQTRDIAKPYDTYHTFGGGPQDEKEFELCFHPSLPVIAFTSSMSTKVWDFCTDKTYKIGPGVHNVIRMTYSSTGDYCILEPLGSLPQILQVPPSVKEELEAQYNTPPSPPVEVSPPPSPPLSHVPLRQDPDSSPPPPNVTTPTSGAVTKVDTSTYPLAEGRAVLSGSNLFLSSNTDHQPAHISITNNGTQVSMTHWNSTTDAEDDKVNPDSISNTNQTITLTRLPRWTASDSARASVIPAKNESEPVRVVLDKSADNWSKLQLRRGDAYPLVVEKHLASFGKEPSASGALSEKTGKDVESTWDGVEDYSMLKSKSPRKDGSELESTEGGKSGSEVESHERKREDT
ncbi:hypothetical protein QBC34DRAFT_489662 [Podospora aff. communis PSN243]|uniref:Nephrocystin 3-like N-terminal domain-containing protein n=1 Tax=Podospora aff. communis PSN243 TaxID=3040156 RepID=A0AAV9H5W1_9PEZI|nr:hypothetical protein QBC34DRAFT_489662 [Podospora aff. communis PSN243]